jgi:2-polyprenyl-3-methyl-5-hydroxy-6-metoxy-1,4-benzoquinol methylase
VLTERLRARLRRTGWPARARRDGSVARHAARAVPSADDPDSWFTSQYEETAQAIINFLGDVHFSMTGQDVADIGCGDGILDLGLAHKAQPRRLVGYDLDLTTEEIRSNLTRAAEHAGLAPELPPCLDFERSEPLSNPAADDSFDFVITWSAFERLDEPVAVAREMRRVIRPSGMLFVRHEFHSLDRITLDELQRVLLAAGFLVRVVKIDTPTVNLPGEADRYRLADLGVSGIKLVAAPC